MQSKAFRYPRIIALFISLATLSVRSAHCADDPASTPTPPPVKTAGSPALPREAPVKAVENSVVKVFSTLRYPDVYKPWTKQAPSEATGSGVVIEGKRILTIAHVVNYASQIQIQASQSGDKVSATVEAIAPGIDLAVLKLDDETFFDTHAPVSRAKALPEIKDAVMVYGYPAGGTSLSITKGIVSRIEFSAYHSFVSGLRIQIDAAINAGNSGGPAIAGDKMIGLAFSRLGESQNIGYIIPCEEIELFLKDIAQGHYQGKPEMSDELQTLESPALRTFLKLDKSVEGMVVHRPRSGEPSYPLKEWDVITRIGDNPVDDQGMIKIEHNLRVRFAYMIQKIAKDGKVPLTIIRHGKELQVELPVLDKRESFLPSLDGAYPSYFVYGPMVFSNATTDFVAGLTRGPKAASVMFGLAYTGNPLISRTGDKSAFGGERLVVVSSPFFPHKLSIGYTTPFPQVVKSINGIPVKNLDHLVEILRDAKEEFITVEFNGRGVETLVFPRAEMAAATEEILTDNGVRSQGSPDTLAVWKAAPAQ